MNTTELKRDNGPSGSSLPVDRREFLKTVGVLGGGLLVYFTVGNRFAAAQMPFMNYPTDFNAYLRIATDGSVTCFTGKIDMGQGTITSLPQIVAEELKVAYESVKIIMGDTDLCPWDLGTFGSMNIRLFGPVLRKAACEARGVLKELASEKLGCPMDRLLTENGTVFDRNRPERKVTYGELTQGKIIERHLKETPAETPPEKFTIMGKPYLHQDARDKVTGRAQYTGDIRLPGMLYAAILRPPAHGAVLKRLDVSDAKNMEGVTVIQDGDLVAVLHALPDQAVRALERVDAVFEEPQTGTDNETIYDHLIKTVPNPRVVSQSGDIQEGRRLAKHHFEETYRIGYLAHAPIETHTALAKLEKGRVTVWSTTQAPFTLKNSVAETMGMSPEDVRIITPFVGGGFGGKTSNREALEAARLTRLTGKPVQVCFNRAEEFFYDAFAPAAIVKIVSGIDDAGNIVLWDYTVYHAGERNSEVIYNIPHHRIVTLGGWMMATPGAHAFDVGAWRAPGAAINGFARALQINLMAEKAGMDPLEFRLKNLKEERMKSTLKAAAEKIGWKPHATRSGRGFGVACGLDANSYVAHVGEVEVDKESGRVRLKRIVCAQDMGLCVNPQGSTIQMEGCMTMGMGYALAEEVKFRNGKILDTNFDTYTIPRFSWLPTIETVIVDNMDKPPQGCGEPGLVGVGAVIATGIYDATGAKLFQMPMTPKRVKAALNGV
jgi:nicotinate dehydrogenase subunit B